MGFESRLRDVSTHQSRQASVIKLFVLNKSCFFLLFLRQHIAILNSVRCQIVYDSVSRERRVVLLLPVFWEKVLFVVQEFYLV